MANKNRVFISFAIEDESYRNLLRGQARNEKSTFEFVDMSVKEPWNEKWKTNCRTRIKGCDGVIALISKNTPQATGALWEIECAKEERIPIRGIYANVNDKPAFLPTQLSGVSVVIWTWGNIKTFLDSL